MIAQRGSDGHRWFSDAKNSRVGATKGLEMQEQMLRCAQHDVLYYSVLSALFDASVYLFLPPRLQFEDVPFRIGDIDKRQSADAFQILRNHGSDGFSAVGQDLLQHLRDIIDFKGDV